MAQIISSYNVAHQLQNYVCEALSASEWLQQLSVNFFPENAKDIDYQIKNALAKQGLACVVMTPNLEYQGHDGTDIAWDAKDLTLQIAEYTPINRASNKLSVVTGLDLAVFAQNYLGGPQCAEEFGRFCPKAVTQSEEGGLLITKATFDTTVLGQIDGPYAWDGHHVITAPWALLSDLLELSAYTHSLPSVDIKPLEEQISAISSDLSNYLQLSGGTLAQVGNVHSAELTPSKIAMKSSETAVQAEIVYNNFRVTDSQSGMEFNNQRFLTWTNADISPSALLSAFQFVTFNGLSTLADIVGSGPDMSNYYTKAEIDGMIGDIEELLETT